VVGRMDNLDKICIRFHFGGAFTNVGGSYSMLVEILLTHG
jgi:hypothetical protein